MFTLVTTRFNNETYKENQDFKKKYNYTGCIYGAPQEMSPKIAIDSFVFVIEMNNSQNQLEGIGLIKNMTRMDKYFKIYFTGNFNRYVYKGKYHIKRDTLVLHNEILVDVLDQLLFKGYRHMKRGSGFTSITEKIVNNDICRNINIKEEIRKIFVQIFGETNDNSV